MVFIVLCCQQFYPVFPLSPQNARRFRGGLPSTRLFISFVKLDVHTLSFRYGETRRLEKHQNIESFNFVCVFPHDRRGHTTANPPHPKSTNNTRANTRIGARPRWPSVRRRSAFRIVNVRGLWYEMGGGSSCENQTSFPSQQTHQQQVSATPLRAFNVVLVKVSRRFGLRVFSYFNVQRWPATSFRRGAMRKRCLCTISRYLIANKRKCRDPRRQNESVG